MTISGKENKMNTKEKYNSPAKFVVATVVMILMCDICVPVVNAEDDIWTDNPKSQRGQYKLTEEKINRMIERIAKEGPEKAKRLEKLRKDNPQEFEKQIRQIAREHFQKLQKQRPGKNKGHGSKGMGPGKPSGKGKGMMPGMEMMPGRGGGSSGYWQQMTQRHKEYIKWLEENYPQEAQKLAKLREKDPKTYARHIHASRKTYSEIMDAAKENPELAGILKEDLLLKQERNILLKSYRAASDKDKKKLQKQLEELVAQRFDIVLRKKQLRYEHLRQRLEKLKTRLSQQEAEVNNLKNKKDDAVKSRVQELIGTTEKIDWN